MLAKFKLLLDKLESRLINYFDKWPNIASEFKEFLTKYLAYIVLIFGFLCLLSAYDLWHAGNTVNSLISYSNSYGSIYGIPKVAINHHRNLFFYLSLILIIIEAFLYIKSYPAVKKHLKIGWNLIFYALLVNFLCGFSMLLNTYGGIYSLLARALFSLICLYVIFEIRDNFHTNKQKPHKKSAQSMAN